MKKQLVKSDSAVRMVESGIAAAIAVFSFGVLVFLIACSVPSFPTISDFPEYYAPARMVVTGSGADVYNLTALGAEEHSLYPAMADRTVALFIPPPGLVLLTPLAVLPQQAAPFIWKFILASCLGGIIFICRRFFALPFKQACYLCAALFLSQAAFESLRIDQLAPIFVLAFVTALQMLTRGKDKYAGLLLAVFILKPQQIVPFVFFLAGSGRWQVIKWGAIALAVLTLLSVFIVGVPGFQNYLALVRSPESLAHMQPELTPTLRGQLLRLELLPSIHAIPHIGTLITATTALFYASACGFAFWLAKRARNSDKALELGVLTTIPLTVVSSFHCHSYDLLLLVPTILMLFTDRPVTTSPFVKLAIMAVGAIFVVPSCIYLHYDYLLKGGIANPWFAALCLLAAMTSFLSLRYLTKAKTAG